MAVESYVVVQQHSQEAQRRYTRPKRHRLSASLSSSWSAAESSTPFGSHGSTSHLRFRHFHSLQDARLFLSRREIVIFAALRSLMMLCLSITTLLPRAPFLLGNEVIFQPFFAKELEICDFFVYIPQYGGGTASLNVTVAASIVLHQFGDNE
ncbi:hypothetical protein GBA52_003888 [Prunus armeniaca]|nr:hypothetical protein GBA52_003888 [Prunus armeniaca]